MSPQYIVSRSFYRVHALIVYDQRTYNARSKVLARERDRAMQREKEKEMLRNIVAQRQKRKQDARQRREERKRERERERQGRRSRREAAVWPRWCQKLAIVLGLRRSQPN
jgi:hypothetical protein